MGVFSQISIKVRQPVIKLVKKPTPCTYIGPGYVKKMGDILTMLGVERACIITDGFLGSSGLLDGMKESIDEAKVAYTVFDGVQSDPTFAVVASAQLAAEGCDAVIAVGGGSVIDTAKAVSAALANHCSAEKLVGILKVRRYPVTFIAVPTTAGTGSETTVAAVISDSKTHAKKQLLDPKLVPTIAVLDPELTVGLPPHTTAHTALDALTHALEAYVAGYADAETDRQARVAIRLIYKDLPRVRENPADLKAREHLLVASFFAGLAFTRTYVGYVHAFAHTIGAKYGVPHGLANAVLLPHIMRYYLPKCHRQFAELAVITGVAAKSVPEHERAKLFVKSLYAMNKACGIPERFDKFPAEDIDSVIDMAFKECHGIYPVPRYYTRESARKLLQLVCRD